MRVDTTATIHTIAINVGVNSPSSRPLFRITNPTRPRVFISTQTAVRSRSVGPARSAGIAAPASFPTITRPLTATHQHQSRGE